MKKILPIFLLLCSTLDAAELVRVGSKKFTEGYLVSEILAQLIESQTILQVERKFGLGGTAVCFEALKSGAIDLYPEYSGTALEVLLHGQGILDLEGLRKIFRNDYNLEWLEPLGFNNTYALAVTAPMAEGRGIRKISALREHPDLVFGLSHEFLNRRDGWPALSQAYRLAPSEVRGLDHGLAYESIAAAKIHVMDAYSTDAKIGKFGLALLEDDLDFFPKYLAAPLVRQELLRRHPEVASALNQIAGKIDEATMQRLNAAVELEGKSFAEVAHDFLVTEGLVKSRPVTTPRRGIGQLLLEHLGLTFSSVFLAALVAIPAGVLVSRRRRAAQWVIGVAGVAQTIPGIALLVFMIPLFGIGTTPAIAALFLYGLLPILRNSCTGLREISPDLLEAADGIGLTRRQRLFHVELPLATRFILAGVRTGTVINIGTATLAAFIGAGGLGERIVTGLALNDTRIVLSGAIPAALLAIVAEILFEGMERRMTPRGIAHTGTRA